jgi:CHAT domain-containing protein
MRRKEMKAFVSTLFLVLSLAVVYPSGTSSHSSQGNETKAGTLEPGKPIERELAGGQTHSYLINATANQYIQVIVEERGIEVVLTLFAPDGEKLTEVDGIYERPSSKSASMITEPGVYKLEIRANGKDEASGKYEARIAQMRAATEQDRNHVAAQTAFSEAERLLARSDAESLQGAIRKYEEALTLYRVTGNHSGEASALSRLGETYRNTGELKSALDHWEQELAIRRALGDRGGEAVALLGIGTVYDDLSEKQKALDYDNQALLLHRDLGDGVGEANVLINIGWIYSSVRELPKALDYFTQALSLTRACGHREGEARALLGIGVTYTFLGERQKALDYDNQALSLNRAIGARREEAFALHDLAWLYGDLGEKQKALDYNQQALLLMRELGHRKGEIYILHSLGWIYQSSGEKQKAIGYYNQVLPLRRAVGDRMGEADTLYRLAQCESACGDLGEARVHIDAAIDIMESIRAKIGSQESRANYIAFSQASYKFYIELLLQLHQRSQTEGYDAAALQISERARARSLLDLLIEARAEIRHGVDGALLERERHLQQIITAKTDRRIRLLNSTHTEQQTAAATRELEALASEYEEVEAKIRTTSPRYAALTQPQTLKLGEIQQLLDPDTMLLEYALGEEHSYLWAVTRDSIASFMLEKESVIEVAAQRVYELLTARTKRIASETPQRRKIRIAEADAEYNTAAAALSDMLLAPVAAQLGNQRLVIVSDGVLQYIPFASLPVPEMEKTRGKQTSRKQTNRRVGGSPLPDVVGVPMMVEHEIVNLPSVSTLALLRRDLEGRKSPAKTVAVLADPVFEATDIRVIQKSMSKPSQKSADKTGLRAAQSGDDQKADDDRRRFRAIEDYLLRTRMIEEGQPLARLPYSRKEAMAIASLVPKGQRKIALNFDVNYKTATSAELGEYRFVHFATHGLLDTDQPELSGMLLSLVDNEGRPQENGILRLGDVYNLKLPVDMVALSGCETALGKSIRGEGLVGLTRGFMYAGAPRVLSSLWKVEEAATAELMKTFYEGVLGAQQRRPADALRRAQIEMWRKPRHRAPYYWSAFVLQGEWR